MATKVNGRSPGDAYDAQYGNISNIPRSPVLGALSDIARSVRDAGNYVLPLPEFFFGGGLGSFLLGDTSGALDDQSYGFPLVRGFASPRSATGGATLQTSHFDRRLIDIAGAIPLIPPVARLAGRTVKELPGIVRDAAMDTSFAGAAPIKKISADDVSRAKSRVGATGQHVGAPKGVDTPGALAAVTKSYADRIKDSLDRGIEPGYFYGAAAKDNALITDSADAARKFARLNAVTSSEAPVRTNVGWAIKAMEQNAMGAPIYAGKYPNAMRADLEDVLSGGNKYLGHKRERYAAGLSGEGGLAPNDRWEIRSVGGERGYPGDTAGPAQHDFIDSVRQKAADIVLRDRGLPLTPHEAQELNWFSARAKPEDVLNRDTDTAHGALPYYTMQHSWESVPGATSEHLSPLRQVSPEQQAAYHEQIKGVLLDERNKDKLIRGMGGELQLPAFDAPGVYGAQVSPGTQSRSLVAHTMDKGLDPTSRARVEATEAVRAYLTGQDAYAGHLMQPSKSVTAADTMGYVMGAPADEAAIRRAMGIIDPVIGEGNAAYVPSGTGLRVLSLGADKFGKNMSKLDPQIREALNATDSAAGTRAGTGFYNEVPWSTGGATEHILKAIDNPNAPRLAEHADSPIVRGIARQISEINDAYSAQGIAPNPKLQMALKVWAEEGLAGLRRLQSSGLAPAAILGIPGLEAYLSSEAGGKYQ